MVTGFLPSFAVVLLFLIEFFFPFWAFGRFFLTVPGFLYLVLSFFSRFSLVSTTFTGFYLVFLFVWVSDGFFSVVPVFFYIIVPSIFNFCTYF